MRSKRVHYRLTTFGLGLTIALGAGSAAAAPLRFEAADAAPGSAVLELQADELVTMTAIPFRLILRAENGRHITGARVDCSLTMPSMVMPENRPKISERDRVYGGEMILTCAMGDWRMSCAIEDAHGPRRTLTFDLGTARLK